MIPDSERYDRQIRVYGLNSQQQLSRTKFLIVGSNLLAQEVIKNLVLSGVNYVAVLSTRLEPAPGILGSLDSNNDVIIRCNQMNANVHVEFISQLPERPETKFDAVLVTDLSYTKHTFDLATKRVYYLFSNGPIGIFVHPVDTKTNSLVSYLTNVEPVFVTENESTKRCNKNRIHPSFFMYNSFVREASLSESLKHHNVCPATFDKLLTEMRQDGLSVDLSSQYALPLHQEASVCSVLGGFACQYLIKSIADSQNISFAGNCFAFDSTLDNTCALYQLKVKE